MTRSDRWGEDDPTDGGYDRGQLLLVGAVSVALVFLGLVVVFNTVLFTDSTAPTESLESVEEARSFEEQTRNDTRMILFRVAKESGEEECGLTGDDFCTYARDNLTAYSLNISTSYADTGPVYAAVKVHNVSGILDIGFACDGVTGSTTLCANVSVVYETSEFTYNNTITVATEAP